MSFRNDTGTLFPLSSIPLVVALFFPSVHVPGRRISLRVWDPRGVESYDGLCRTEVAREQAAIKSDIESVSQMDMLPQATASVELYSRY